MKNVFQKEKYPIIFFSIFIILVFPVLCCADSSIVWKSGDIGIIQKNETALWSSINDDRQLLVSLPENAQFEVIQASDPWLQIKVNGYQGWINNTFARLPQYYDGKEYASVNNPDANDRLHLRTKASSKSDSIGKYYNGTKVILLSGKNNSEWTYVQIGDVKGYMMTKYLAFGDAADQVISAQPTVTISNKSGNGLNLRTGQNERSSILRLLNNGTTVTVLGVSEEWVHVIANNQTGFIKASGINPKLSYSYSTSTTQKGRITKVCSVYKTPFTNPNDADDLVMGVLDEGDIVTVYSVKNGWAQISYGNYKYYVQTDSINIQSSQKQQSKSPSTGKIIRDCTVYVSPVSNPEDADDLSRGVLSEGDIVTVYSMKNGWVRVSYGNYKYYIHEEDINISNK